MKQKNDSPHPIQDSFSTMQAQEAPSDSAPRVQPAVEVLADGVGAQVEQTVLFPESLAQRLVAARDARGLSTAGVAEKLRLPLRIIEAIETEQFDRIGHGIYLRGYLTSYARLVGVPIDAVDGAMNQHAAPAPTLVATGRISHSRYLYERYSGSAVYVVLTAFIVVPMVMFGLNWGNNNAKLTPLDVPAPQAANDAQGPNSSAVAANDAAAAPAPDGAQTEQAATTTPAANNSPVMASFAPLPNFNPADAQALAPSQPLAGGIRLTLSEPSWVEVLDVDGKRLEYATLPAGTVKTYPSDKALDIHLGNALGVKIDVDGLGQDIASYSRGNVAHFVLASAAKTISKPE